MADSNSSPSGTTNHVYIGPIYPTLIPLFEQLEGPRLILRPYRLDDAETVHTAINESQESLSLWLPWAETHQTVDDTRDFILRSHADWILRAELRLGLFLRQTGQFLGGSGFHHINWRARTFEIGYWLRQSAEGHGYMREAVIVQTRYLFESLAAQHVVIVCDARNTRSRHVPERLGFIQEGYLRSDSIAPDGQLRDTLVFGLTPEDYRHVGDSWLLA